jgi:hypothetical protein
MPQTNLPGRCDVAERPQARGLLREYLRWLTL